MIETPAPRTSTSEARVVIGTGEDTMMICGADSFFLASSNGAVEKSGGTWFK